MDKYLMTQAWLKKLIPETRVCDMTRVVYQQLLNDYAATHERQTRIIDIKIVPPAKTHCVPFRVGLRLYRNESSKTFDLPAFHRIFLMRIDFHCRIWYDMTISYF